MNQSSGMNESLRYRYLDELQNKTNLTLIPVFIYLFLLLFLGLLGNSLILVVYLKKQRKTATIILILSIALLDLITNIVIIPASLYDFFHTWNYSHAPLCKSYLYLNNFMASASAILLLAVAVVRYRKICNPFKKQVTAKQAKIISAAIILISLVWSIPYGITHGRQTKTTPNKNITGFHCSIDDDFVGTIWPEVVNGFAIVVFLACGIPLSAMYVFIGVQAWKHSQIYGMRTSSRRRHAAQAKIKNNVVEPGLKNEDKTEEKSTSTDEDEEEETEETKEQNRTQETIDLSLTKENKNETSSVSGITATQSKTGNAVTDLPTNRNRRHVNGKTTLMLFAISAVYVVTNLTTLCLVLVRAVKTDYINSLGMVADSFYKLFMLSYLLNCAVNPIIYSMCDKHFRQQCLYILSYLRCC